MKNTTTYAETKETFANELVLKYGYLIDPIASGLIGEWTFVDREDLHQQGILIIMEGVKGNKLKFPCPITSEMDIISTLTEYLTKELSVYIKNIDSYMSRKVRCNRISNRNKEKIISESLFKDCESKIDKNVLYSIMYPGGYYSKYNVVENIIYYLMDLGIFPHFPVEIILADEKEVNNILEAIAEYIQ